MAASAEQLPRRRVALWAKRAADLARLMRADRPIGIFLLLWPVMWALWIAGNGHPDAFVTFVFIAGVIVMRSAGCVINDFIDRNIDPRVERTRSRPLAARRVYPHEALTLFGILILCALVLVLQLDEATVRMSFVGAALTVTYPFMKRFFPLPQLYLGAAFRLGRAHGVHGADRRSAARGLAAVRGDGAVAGVYDTVYAMVDRDDDLRVGVQSSAILFGDLDRVIVGAMQLMVLLGLAFAGQALGLGMAYWIGLACGAVLFAWQQWLIRERERDECFRAFLNNNYFGFAVFVGIIAEFALRG